MTDVLVRDVPDDVVAALDARASRLGLSRNEYLRRRLAQEGVKAAPPVTVADLASFASTFADLGNSEVMKGAWSERLAGRQISPGEAWHHPGCRHVGRAD